MQILSEYKSTLDCFRIVGFCYTSRIAQNAWKANSPGASWFSIRLWMYWLHFHSFLSVETLLHVLRPENRCFLTLGLLTIRQTGPCSRIVYRRMCLRSLSTSWRLYTQTPQAERGYTTTFLHCFNPAVELGEVAQLHHSSLTLLSTTFWK